ncbi:hypothetical protein C8T65DRAFT_634875 [Cerioporus squamosus]|nr:hypothetical protein C8T65DRAFT_634875 [Cerioporus squamosus]
MASTPLGYSSSTSSSSGTIRPGSGYASGSSSTTTLSTSSSSSRMPRPTVHRVPRGAGDSKPSLPKPRSVSRPAPRKHSKPNTPPPTRASSILEQWVCPRCTLMNDALALQCAACLALRPRVTELEHQMTRDTGGGRARPAASATCPLTSGRAASVGASRSPRKAGGIALHRLTTCFSRV